jgi:hypothetical protein
MCMDRQTVILITDPRSCTHLKKYFIPFISGTLNSFFWSLKYRILRAKNCLAPKFLGWLMQWPSLTEYTQRYATHHLRLLYVAVTKGWSAALFYDQQAQMNSSMLLRNSGAALSQNCPITATDQRTSDNHQAQGRRIRGLVTRLRAADPSVNTCRLDRRLFRRIIYHNRYHHPSGISGLQLGMVRQYCNSHIHTFCFFPHL